MHAKAIYNVFDSQHHESYDHIARRQSRAAGVLCNKMIPIPVFQYIIEADA